MKITGDVRDGAEFCFSAKPTNAAPSTFAAVLPNELRVTRYASQLFSLPDDTPVLAHWHGQSRTDGFATTVGELRAKADVIYGPDALKKAIDGAKTAGITVKIERSDKHISAFISGYGNVSVPKRDESFLVGKIREEVGRRSKATVPHSAIVTGTLGTALGSSIVATTFVPGATFAPGLGVSCGTGAVN